MSIQEGKDELSDNCPVDRDNLDRCHSRSPFDLRQTILGSQVMITAYAIALIILCLGMVVMTITLMVLCFFFPPQANSFLLLLTGPVAALIVSQSFGLSKLINRGKDSKELKE